MISKSLWKYLRRKILHFNTIIPSTNVALSDIWWYVIWILWAPPLLWYDNFPNFQTVNTSTNAHMYMLRPGLCLYQAILFVYWCFCYWPFRDTVPHNSKNLPSVRWIHRSEFLAFIGECNGQTYINELSTSLTRVFALSRQVTMVGMFYNLRKKFWSGNFRHFKIPMYA